MVRPDTGNIATCSTEGIPNDGTPVRNIVTVSPAVTAIYSLASVAGFILAFACAVFNFVHRKKKWVSVVLQARFPVAIHFTNAKHFYGSTAYREWLGKMMNHCSFCRLIRLSSPKLNYIIILGATCFYVSRIFLVLPSLDPNVIVVHCNVSHTDVYYYIYLSECSLLGLTAAYSSDNLHWLLHVLWNHLSEDVPGMVHLQSSQFTKEICKCM